MNTSAPSHVSKRTRTTACLAAVLVGLCTLAFNTYGHRTGLIDRFARDSRIGLISKKPSGRIVIVGFDDASIKKVGPWPWPRSVHGRLIDRLREYGASKVLFDIDFSDPSPNPAQDRLMAMALHRFMGHVYIGGGYPTAKPNPGASEQLATPVLEERSHRISTMQFYDDDTTLRSLRWSTFASHGIVATLSAAAVDAPSRSVQDTYLVDWTIDPARVPSYRYEDVLAGRVPISDLRGKVVVVAPTTTGQDETRMPNERRVPGVYAHVLGAETLLRGEDREIPGIIPLALLLAAIVSAVTLPTGRVATAYASAGVLSGILVLQLLVEEGFQVRMDVDPSFWAAVASLCVQLVSAIAATLSEGPMRFESTGIPNLAAMRRARPPSGPTCVLRQRNYVETTAMLGFERQAKLLVMIREVAREHVASEIYQTDAHTLAWRTTSTAEKARDLIETVIGQLSSGLHVDGSLVDAIVCGGVTPESDDDLAAVVNSAVMAAETAARTNRTVSIHTDDHDTRWHASLLTELDMAIDAGHVWVAYQPKIDLASGQVAGCEALVRWNHPERGTIRPDQFIPIVEQAGRSERLTRFILDTAMRETRGRNIAVAVNISATLLGRGRLFPLVTELLERHAFPPERLILEITESADMGGAAGMSELRMLSAPGVRISIDDYGTGKSTLAYLQNMPVSELKIDQSFIRPMLANERNGTLVESSIKLAHSLGMTVVAEGVETKEIMDRLAEMDCDMVQGWHLGRPVPITELETGDRLLPPRNRRWTDEQSDVGMLLERMERSVPCELEVDAFTYAMRGLPTAMFVKDHRTRRCLFVNDAFERLCRIPAEALVGRHIREVMTNDDGVELTRQEDGLAFDGQTIVHDHRMTTPAGTRIIKITVRLKKRPDGNDLVIGIAEDVTEERRAVNRLAQMALHDPLTGSLNRNRYHEALADLLARDEKTGVVYVDLDHFKAVNDRHGHAGGDAVLVETAKRLQEATRCLVARLGGDEFAILVEDATYTEEVAAAAVEAISMPYQIDGHAVMVGGSAGAAIGAARDGDAQALLRRADAALYRAKQEGRNAYRMDAGVALSTIAPAIAEKDLAA